MPCTADLACSARVLTSCLMQGPAYKKVNPVAGIPFITFLSTKYLTFDNIDAKEQDLP